VLQDMKRLVDPSDARPMAQRLWEVLLIYHRHLHDQPGLRSMVRGEIVRGAEGITDIIETRIRPVQEAVFALVQQGMHRGELRGDLQPMLTTFFLVKMQLEILDVLPVLAPRLMKVTPEAAVKAGMRAWFDLYWRGVAADPMAPLPELPDPIN